ncbi:MAG: hypothetical protein E6Q24_04775 [Chitinophagaceae bacterium]|nr:MAG: hypothetical protein E6Q24_04775 [Chitinophagaceae bacterium]
MKKNYLLGGFAVALAIGMSAFSTIKKPVDKKVLLNTYTRWYSTQASGTQVGTLFYNSTAVDKNHVPLNPCPDANLPVCMVGSNSPLTQGTAIPPAQGTGNPGNPDDADNYILED